MTPLVLRSIFKKFLTGISCLLVCTALAGAQHPAARTAGGTVRVLPPPVVYAPIYAPTIHAPIYAGPTSRGPSADAFGRTGFRPPPHPIRPYPPALIILESPFFRAEPFWGLNSCWWSNCDLFWPWTFGYATVSSPGPTTYISQTYETPLYGYGEERPDIPQLFLKDGTILNVTDYWLVDDQLHFTMIEEDGKKPVEHVIPFEALDLQTTVDANTRRGFRFMLRNEPFEQYIRDHPEGPPQVVTPHD
jgi:hypothetical protein